jgi:hypothetical protein
MNKQDFPVNLDNALKMFVKSCHNLAYPHFSNRLNVDRDPFKPLPSVAVTNELNNFIGEIEWCLSELRSNLHLSNWNELANIKPIEFTNLPRKKYVTAREEIAKAKEILEENPEDVMMHLRTAIDLSLKERFGFKDIRGMGAFIDEAKEFDFPLPSYDLIYYYFDEGSKRSHQGKVHMQFDAKEAIRTVSDFIDELETIEVTQEKIDRFVRDSKSVRI